MKRTLTTLFTACCLLAACGPTPEPVPDSGDDSVSKFDARKRVAKGDSNVDFCAKFGWYDDGICDDFCANPDPDCQATSECTSDSDCGDGEYCQPGFCYLYCSVDDLDCCESNHCAPVEDPQPAPDPGDDGGDDGEPIDPEQDECDVDADCASGESCVELPCPAFCAEGADCCPDVCVADDVDDEPTSCKEDADCSGDEVCELPTCFLACDAADPDCCPGTCTPPEFVDECESDSDCSNGEVCTPGLCLLHCSVDDPTCCGPNTCEAI